MEDVTLIKQTIQEADAILITAGAGIGVDSGLQKSDLLEH